MRFEITPNGTEFLETGKLGTTVLRERIQSPMPHSGAYVGTSGFGGGERETFRSTVYAKGEWVAELRAALQAHDWAAAVALCPGDGELSVTTPAPGHLECLTYGTRILATRRVPGHRLNR